MRHLTGVHNPVLFDIFFFFIGPRFFLDQKTHLLVTALTLISPKSRQMGGYKNSSRVLGNSCSTDQSQLYSISELQLATQVQHHTLQQSFHISLQWHCVDCKGDYLCLGWHYTQFSIHCTDPKQFSIPVQRSH